ncbi:hypothetical protein N7468_009828 [Penicillium chermesinum]|uniref:Uncharacterized protein n=1 Tax=Penicillium chermesinum TaxID=63820 RepID=A0A9W9NBJ4_9EURO|nr:uncharacterized protein N7468_009828 [Penicillium chermesinum]KAJ5216820.1 hypothetical protein N7468_009828 [Penicillium chermesinum]
MSNARHTVGGATTHPTRRPTRGGGGGGVARAPRAWAGGMEKAPHANTRCLAEAAPHGQEIPQDFEQAMKAAHPVCEKMIREADQRYQQLAAHLEQSQEEKARLQSMADQANADKHAACNEVGRLKGEIARLQDHVGNLESDPQGYIRRAELNTVLEEIHAVATSLTGKVWKKLEESNNVYFSTCLPGDGYAETTWEGQKEQVGMPGSPLLPVYPDPMMSCPEPQDLSYIDPYTSVPQGKC